MVTLTTKVTTEKSFDVYDVKAIHHIKVEMKDANNINIDGTCVYLDDGEDQIEELGTKHTERMMTFTQFPTEVKNAILALKAYVETIAKEDIGLT